MRHEAKEFLLLGTVGTVFWLFALEFSWIRTSQSQEALILQVFLAPLAIMAARRWWATYCRGAARTLPAKGTIETDALNAGIGKLGKRVRIALVILTTVAVLGIGYQVWAQWWLSRLTLPEKLTHYELELSELELFAETEGGLVRDTRLSYALEQAGAKTLPRRWALLTVKNNSSRPQHDLTLFLHIYNAANRQTHRRSESLQVLYPGETGEIWIKLDSWNQRTARVVDIQVRQP